MHASTTTVLRNRTALGLRAGLAAVVLVGAASAQEPAAPPAADDTDLEAAWQQVLGSREGHVERNVAAAREGGLDADLPPAPLGTSVAHTGWRHTLFIGGRQLSRADFESTPGESERRTYELGWRGEVGAPETSWRLEYTFENHVYRFDGATGLLPSTSAPVEGLFAHRFGARRDFELPGAWSGSLAAGIDIGLEGSADIGDALTWNTVATATWRARGDVAVKLGFLAQDRLEDDPFVVPFVGLDWDVDTDTSVMLDGDGLVLARDVGRDTELYLRARYENRQFRLDDSGPNPDGALEDSSFQAFVGLDLPVGIASGTFASTRLDVFVGAQFARRLEFRTSDIVVGGDDPDPSALFGLRLYLGL